MILGGRQMEHEDETRNKKHVKLKFNISHIIPTKIPKSVYLKS